MIIIVGIVKKTLKSQVYDYLKEQITIGNIKPGERLIEEKIGQTLDVSRSPIREAIRMLEKDGFLHLTKTGGVEVVKPSLVDYQYLFECRIEMESVAAYYAATRRTEEQLEQIENAIDTYSSGSIINDKSNVRVGFHDIIIESSMNPFLISMLRQLRGVNSFYRKAIVETDPKHVNAAEVDHEEIYAAIAASDQELARKLMKKHIENDYSRFISLIKGKTEG